jgi:hypothetical protein
MPKQSSTKSSKGEKPRSSRRTRPGAYNSIDDRARTDAIFNLNARVYWAVERRYFLKPGAPVTLLELARDVGVAGRGAKTSIHRAVKALEAGGYVTHKSRRGDYEGDIILPAWVSASMRTPGDRSVSGNANTTVSKNANTPVRRRADTPSARKRTNKNRPSYQTNKQTRETDVLSPEFVELWQEWPDASLGDQSEALAAWHRATEIATPVEILAAGHVYLKRPRVREKDFKFCLRLDNFLTKELTGALRAAEAEPKASWDGTLKMWVPNETLHMIIHRYLQDGEIWDARWGQKPDEETMKDLVRFVSDVKSIAAQRQQAEALVFDPMQQQYVLVK